MQLSGTGFTNSAFFMPIEILYSPNNKYSAVFVYYENVQDYEDDEDLGERNHIVTIDIPYKLSCSNGSLSLLGDNDIATPYILSDQAEGSLSPFEFNFNTYHYGR